MAPHRIRVPDLGEGIAEVELVAWRVAPGDTVAEDQVLADVMTDKATVEIPSPVAGRVLALGGEVGQSLAVGSELIRIDREAGPAADAPAADAVAPAPVPVPVTVPDPRPAPTPAPAVRAIASPALRARAWELGVDLAQVVPTGTAGRVTQADLDDHVARHGVQPQRAGPEPASRTEVRETREVKIVGLRRRIAQRMQEAKRRIPHYTYVEEVDVGAVESLRGQLNARWQGQRAHLTLLPFIVQAMVLALRDWPQVNAWLDDEAGVITEHGAVHLGIATQTDAGLMVPVLRDAQSLDLWGCATGIARLAAAARSGRIARDELTGSTVTVTSLGRLGGLMSTPVINRPEVAIVGINRIVQRPVMRDGAVFGRPVMNLSSSFDHRVVDGAVAAGFVQQLREALEQPATLFLG